MSESTARNDYVLPKSVSYARAPILESIIDLRTQSKKVLSTGALRKFCERYKDAFPVAEELHTTSVQVNLGKNPDEAKASHSQIGFKLTSVDPPRVLQVRVDGISYSHLAPYSDWKTFSTEALKYWDSYKASFRPTEVVRSALRTINRLEIPEMKFQLEKYLRSYPHVEVAGDEAISSFFMQLQIPQEKVDPDTQALINITSAEPSGRGTSAIIFDIDLFSRSIRAADDSEVWKFLEVLHIRRNEIFESSITEDTRRLFQ
jgi:uncharacterized protein (TIGR04255 family)